jgi:hypothetical protein
MPRSSIRIDARLDATTREKVDDLAKHFYRPRAAVLCQIMHWGLSHQQTEPLNQREVQGPMLHLHLYVPSDLPEQVEKAATAAGVKIAPWLRHMVRRIAIADFPASWQDTTPRECSHDSRNYETRLMMRLHRTSALKIQELVDRFDVPKAQIIRYLIAQAKPEDFPKSWHMRIAQRRMQQSLRDDMGRTQEPRP